MLDFNSFLLLYFYTKEINKFNNSFLKCKNNFQGRGWGVGWGAEGKNTPSRFMLQKQETNPVLMSCVARLHTLPTNLHTYLNC